jgi:hypothetical protein
MGYYVIAIYKIENNTIKDITTDILKNKPFTEGRYLTAFKHLLQYHHGMEIGFT